MVSVPSAALRLLEQQHHLATRTDLLGAGISPRQIGRLVRSGLLARVHPTVYRLAAVPLDEIGAARAVCLVSDDICVSHTSAARLLPLRRIPDLGLHVLVTGPRPWLPAATVHSTNLLPETDIRRRPDGIRHTTIARTLFDLALLLPDDELESVIEHALSERLVEVRTVDAVARRMRARGRGGSVRSARVLARRGDGAAVGSHLELVVERAIAAVGLPAPLRQYELTLADGQRIRTDFFWPEHGVILEVDHRTWHADAEAVRRDKERDRATATLGLLTLRVTERDVAGRLGRVIDDLRCVLRARAS